MSKYGKAALKAVDLYHRGLVQNPQQAWTKAATNVFGEERESSINKGCPKCTFLALAEEGLIRGVPPGKYTRSQKNKMYAIRAAKTLCENLGASIDINTLWENVTAGSGVKHNSQLDVVLALWNKDLLECKHC